MTLPEQRFYPVLDIVWKPVMVLGLRVGKQAVWTRAMKEVFPADPKWEDAPYARRWITHTQGL